MRKLLLTSTVILGASLGMLGAANASMFTSTEGNGATTLTPGQIAVHITLRTNVYFAVQGSSATSYKGNKQAVDTMLGYNRLYMGADGLAANGLKYGVSWEIRENFASPTGAGASGNSTKATLYVRRNYVYAGSDQVGIFRFGQTDGPSTLFLLGTFEGFNDGGWNGDVGAAVNGATAPTWAWTDVGNYYTTSKVEYLSPNLAGFDFGASFAPNSGNLADSSGCVGYSGCLTQSASTSLIDAGRADNLYEIAGRYRGNFSGFGIAAEAAYLGSGVVQNSATTTQYDGMSLGDFGVELSFAGVTVGGNYIGGKGQNGGGALAPKGGANLSAWIAGAQYTTGPIVVGASYFAATSQGATDLVGFSQRQENGFAAGGTYSVAPGLVVFLSYLYGTRHQGGYDFLAGTDGPDHNNVQSQVISLGTQFKW